MNKIILMFIISCCYTSLIAQVTVTISTISGENNITIIQSSNSNKNLLITNNTIYNQIEISGNIFDISPNDKSYFILKYNDLGCTISTTNKEKEAASFPIFNLWDENIIALQDNVKNKILINTFSNGFPKIYQLDYINKVKSENIIGQAIELDIQNSNHLDTSLYINLGELNIISKFSAIKSKFSYIILNPANYCINETKYVGKSPGAQRKNIDNNTNSTNIPISNIFNATNLIDGLAKFGITRMKEEANIAFLNKFREELKIEPFISFLPNVSEGLTNTDNIFNFPNYMKTLRENAYEDMNNFPRNMSNFIQSSSVTINDVEAKVSLLSAIELIEGTRHKILASSQIENLSEQDYIKRNSSLKISKSVNFLGCLSRALHTESDNPTATGWARAEDITYVINHDFAFDVWFELFLDQEGTALKNIITNGENTYDKLITNKTCIKKTLITISELTHIAQQINGIKSDSTKRVLYCDFLIKVNDLLQDKTCIDITIDPKVSKSIKNVFTLEKAIVQKHYGLALTQVISILNDFNLNYTISVRECILKKTRILKTIDGKDVIKKFNEYGNFLVNLINATNSDEIATALDLAALPPQSYRQKRKPKHFGATVNMYGGGFVGKEMTKLIFSNNKKDSLLKVDNLIAASMPVGIDLHYGSKIGSFGLFIPIVDVGAVAAFRYSNYTSQLPDLKWANVLAPGIYFEYGLPKFPLTFGIGGQYGPALRNIKIDNTKITNVIDKQNYRLGVKITFDIPIFNIYHR